jgi:hypothetical protein
MSPPADRFVRQFALTQARARSIGSDLPLDTLVRTRALTEADRPPLAPEQAAILDMCRSPIAVAEISAYLDVHLGIARVLVSDLVAVGLVMITEGETSSDGPSLFLLERLLDGLQAL